MYGGQSEFPTHLDIFRRSCAKGCSVLRSCPGLAERLKKRLQTYPISFKIWNLFGKNIIPLRSEKFGTIFDPNILLPCRTIFYPNKFPNYGGWMRMRGLNNPFPVRTMSTGDSASDLPRSSSGRRHLEKLFGRQQYVRQHVELSLLPPLQSSIVWGQTLGA